MNILAFNLRNFDNIADRRRMRAIEDSKYIGEYSQEYFAQAVLKDCIKHHNTIIR